ncbi:MAG: hypothetical protein IPK97_01295 [Ahniella sp.]|nr:hypothetical protein [Ahniella sp.]
MISLIAGIKGEFKFDRVLWLTLSTTMDKQCSILSKAQRQAVRAHLIFAQQQVDDELDREHIKLALERFGSD